MRRRHSRVQSTEPRAVDRKSKEDLGGGWKLAAIQECQYESPSMMVTSKGAMTSGQTGRGHTEGCVEPGIW